VSPGSEDVARWRAVQREVVRRLVPHSHRHQLRSHVNRLTWPLYVGTNVSCNCCDGRFRRFRVYIGDRGHRSLMCPRCGSLGRHRVDWLYLTTQTDALQRPMRLLHVAPEICLEEPLRRLPGIDYLSADYDSTLAMDQVDVTDIKYADDSFDAVICNHVLHLVDDDRVALREINRVIAPGGWALLQSAVDPTRGVTADAHGPTPTTSEGERYEEVWMRNYGRDFEQRLQEAGFDVTVSDFTRHEPPERQRQLGLDPDETIYFCRKLLADGTPGVSAARPGEPVSEHAAAGHDQAE
jgi:SAM-dependent methyltransferase